MVQASLISASASSSAPTSASRLRRPPRLRSSGSFHAGAPIPSIGPYDDDGPSRARRRSSVARSSINNPARRQSIPGYQTFPTAPPKTPVDGPERSFEQDLNEALAHGPDPSDESDGSSSTHTSCSSEEGPTPLPMKQLGLLALLSLAEQTALNSISPYLPTMVDSFPEIPSTRTGLYVGLLASAFALAQLATNLLWGAACDRVGRKPVMLLGTSLLSGCFCLFGFCTRYWHVLVVHVAMGLLNGNAAVVPTVLGELTDRSNQSRAFIWLPLMYSIGGITGPALGGLLVPDDLSGYAFPFLQPNIASAALLGFSVIVLGIWFEETLEDCEAKANLIGMGWIKRLCDCGGRRKQRGRVGSWSSRWPTRSQSGPCLDGAGDEGVEEGEVEGEEGGEEDRSAETTLFGSHSGSQSSAATKDNDKTEDSPTPILRQLLNHTTILVLATYLIFQLSNISFNSLYPIFASARSPTGRELSPESIGLLLSLAGLVTIGFQILLFQPLKARLGNLGTYRFSLLGLGVSMALMPWIGSQDGRPPLAIGTARGWMEAEMATVLVVKNICAVGGLSSVMLLITNSAPSSETLGTLNGIAQSLSAAGRSVGPFLSGALFTLSMQIRPRGELLAWGLFGGISLLGWLGTMAIRGNGLESADWVGDDESDEQEDGNEGQTQPEP